MQMRNLLGAHKRLVSSVAALFVLLLVHAPHAHAGMLIQTWFSSGGPLQGTATTTAIFDHTLITGAGTDTIFVSAFTITSPPLGTFDAVFTAPFDTTHEGNMFIRFVDGAYQSFGNVNKGGAARVRIVNSAGLKRDIALGSVVTGGEINMFSGFFRIGIWQLQPAQTQLIVPEPGTFVFAAMGLLGAGLFSRRLSGR
jgi:PEP-CTERM motif-containing protein